MFTTTSLQVAVLIFAILVLISIFKVRLSALLSGYILVFSLLLAGTPFKDRFTERYITGHGLKTDNYRIRVYFLTMLRFRNY